MLVFFLILELIMVRLDCGCEKIRIRSKIYLINF